MSSPKNLPSLPSNDPIRIVIVGRPNVGKSTLFNRLYGRKRALVHDEPGVTRDRLIGESSWTIFGREVAVELTDTGGIGGDVFEKEIEEQVEIAVSTAEIVLCVFDGRAGTTPGDQAVIQGLRRRNVFEKVPVIGVVNKVDQTDQDVFLGDFYDLGLPEVMGVSAEHALGIEFLKENIVRLTRGEVEGEEEAISEDTNSEGVIPQSVVPSIAIVGRPNAGKSTLLNALVGKERMITSPIAGTTSDSVDTEATINGTRFLFIDTAGIRRKSKTEKGIEVLSVVQATKALERASLAILVMDAEAGIVEQDEKVAGLIERAGCSVIVLLNKWDLVEGKKDVTQKSMIEEVHRAMGFLTYAPIVFASARKKKGLKDLGHLILDVLNQKTTRIGTHELTEWFRRELEIHNPEGAKIYFVHQVSNQPPTFVCHVNEPNKVHFSLSRHFVNAMRERWGFMGSPIRIQFKKSQNMSRSTK